MKITRPVFTVVFALLILFIVNCADAGVLFRDDFKGTRLADSKWSVAGWHLDRTQLGNAPLVSGGMAHLRFDTFDPRHPGRRFLGTEIDSNEAFPIGSGLEFEARVRVNALPAGLVTSLFTYMEWQHAGSNYSDEIDVEFLSKQINEPHPAGDPVQLTTYRAFNNTDPDYDDVSHTISGNAHVPALDLGRFNTILIRWLPDRVEWLVNGNLIWSTTNAVPKVATNMCLNFWAPAKKWREAFSTKLVPAKTAGENRTYYYDVDYVEVRSIAPSAK